MTAEPPTISTGQAAKALGIGKVTLLRWARAGSVTPAWKTPTGYLRWDLDDLLRQLAAQADEPAPDQLTAKFRAAQAAADRQNRKPG